MYIYKKKYKEIRKKKTNKQKKYKEIKKKYLKKNKKKKIKNM